MREVAGGNEPDVRDVEGTLKALADTTRLRILGLLAAGETCVCNIHESLGLPQPKVSRHLAYLRRMGLVETRKEGLWVYYRIAEPAAPVVDVLLATLRHCLGHLATTRRDRDRLHELVGGARACSSDALPVASCCGGTRGKGEASVLATPKPARYPLPASLDDRKRRA
jgi:ArsR family transcriptional regulator